MYKRKLTDWLDGYLEYTDDDEPCELYRKWTAISTIASALQRKCYHRFDRKTFYANFYLILNGPSGARKSTALELMEELTEEVGIEIAADVTSKEKLLVRLKELGEEKEDTPVNRLLQMPQSRQLGMPVEQHSSLTAIADELTVFFPENDQDFVGYLIKLYDCKKHFKYETKTKGDTHIENVWFNLIGGITPDQLKRKFSQEVVGTGLTGRMIIVSSLKNARRNPLQYDTPKQKKIKIGLVNDLRSMLTLAGPFKADKGWEEAYVPWYKVIDRDFSFGNETLAPYETRRASYIHKLSMISSASRGSSMKLTEYDFGRAILILEEVEKSMLEAIVGVGASHEGMILDDVNMFIQGVGEIEFSALLERFMYQVRGKEELLGMVLALQEVGNVRVTQGKVSKKINIKWSRND